MTVGEEALVASNAAHRATFGGLAHADWMKVLVRSQRARVIDGVPMPAFPPVGYQVATHGRSGRGALDEAGRFVAEVDRRAAHAGRPIDAGTRVLDFGCGWGRMLRVFLARVDSHNLHGVDVREDSVTLARQLNPFAQFATVGSTPPLPFADGSFDLIVAYSVFSHLNEAVSRAWITEFARVTTPGGLVMVTTRGSGFIDFVASLSTRALLWRVRLALGRSIGRPWNEAWLRTLQAGFKDLPALQRQLAAGRFVHVPTGGGATLDASFYGESVIPRGYVEREWTDFELVDFIDDPRRLPQALIVLRKPLMPAVATARCWQPAT